MLDGSMLNTAVMAFAGGIYGSCLGALWSFCLCGLLTLLGCAVILGGGSDFLLLQVGLGPLFGPQGGGFMAGIVAASYSAGVRKNHPGGSARDILSPLVGTSWDVLLAGGLGALICVFLAQAIPHISVLQRSDALALAIVIVSFASRAIFHRESPLGNADSIKRHGLLGTDNYKISWIGWMSPPARLLMVGIGIGGLAGGVAMFSQQALLPMVEAGRISPSAAGTVPVIFCWGLSAMSLTALQLGQGPMLKVPVTHGMAVLGAVAFLNTGSLLAGVLGGVFGAFLQELLARMFTNHGSNHLDPPAMTIAAGIFLYSFLP
ncbi:MAG: hypothetical protein LBO77_00780 [Desulfovibrio sp.]|jgi:hypothetical protein|nr:hypothetical protein [Desulfovibrio sp.]